MSVDAIGTLREPVRRAVYEYVVGRGELVGRDEVAGALGIGRTLAAFHLDRLVGADLLEVEYARRTGRSGPGAGRPAKLYRRSAAQHDVSLPPRRYLAAAELLAETVERSGGDEARFGAARERGRSIGAAGGGLAATLAEQGYEPVRQGRVLALRNCPFHQLAQDYPPLVCGMNLALIEGILAGRGGGEGRAVLAPRPDGCCVVVELSKNNSD